jgi:hypothetical protein
VASSFLRLTKFRKDQGSITDENKRGLCNVETTLLEDLKFTFFAQRVLLMGKVLTFVGRATSIGYLTRQARARVHQD